MIIDEQERKDIELKLLSGVPIKVDDVGFIHSPVLKEIVEIGESKYNQILSFLLFDKSQVKELSEVQESNFIITCLYFYHDDHFRKLFSDGFHFMFKEEIRLNDDDSGVFFYLGDKRDHRIINEEKLLKIQEIIKIANRIKVDNESEYRPANSKARNMIEMILKNREKKPKKKEMMNLQSIISGLAWKANSVHIFNVFDLTIYQLYDGFYRLENIDNYNHILTGIYTGNVDGSQINMPDINWAKILKI